MNMVGCIYSPFLPPWQSLTCLQLFTPMLCSQVSSRKLTPFLTPASPVSRVEVINRFKFSSCHNQLRNRHGHKVKTLQANEQLRNQEWISYPTANNICFDQYSHFIFLEKLFFLTWKIPRKKPLHVVLSLSKRFYGEFKEFRSLDSSLCPNRFISLICTVKRMKSWTIFGLHVLWDQQERFHHRLWYTLNCRDSYTLD